MVLKFDTSEVREFAAVLDRAAGVAPVEARKVVARGALNVKRDAQHRVSGSQHFPKLARAFSYDSHETPAGGWAEIGPDAARPQGNLGFIPEYGSLRTAPRPYMLPAGQAEQPRFEKALQDLAARALEP